MLDIFNEMDNMFRRLDALSQYPISSFNNRGLRSIIRRPHNLLTKKDEAGNVIAERYFDTEGKPVVAVNGFASVVKTYDEAKRVTSEQYFGTDGEPLLVEKTGYAGIERDYDEAGNVIAERYFDTEGNPVHLSNLFFSVDRIVFTDDGE